MKTNIGTIDRIIRFIAGTVLIVWALRGGPAWAWLGLVPLLTATLRFCPAYCLWRGSTCRRG